jgi:glycine cleavage system H protein
LYEGGVARQKPDRRSEKESGGTATILRFSEEDIWVRADGARAQIGLSDYAQEELGEIIAAELPEVGERIETGAPFGELESVRTLRELLAPLNGTVTAVNADIEEHPELVNEDPYHDGWLIEVTLQDESELEELMPPDEYEEG